MPRPGGNPDFGTKYKFETDRPEPLRHKLTIKLTESMMGYLKSLGKDYPEFVREAIAEKMTRHKAATETKTETTEPATRGQPQQHNQTSREDQQEETNPSQQEQTKTPKTQRKARQTQGQTPTKPRNQTRNRKNTVTEN
ncbi:MAG: hypothetical protein MET45_11005 [Nostoc sp. LLA-1]|nr:hypothetical protein [Cyanocohniella sp. LLY]